MPTNVTSTSTQTVLTTNGVASVIFDQYGIAQGTPYVPVRQTVLGMPMDANGYPAPGGVTGATTVTTTAISASAPLVATCANGFGLQGGINYIGMSTSNISWTGLSTNGTMYLYVDISAGGALTPGSTTLAPVYQSGGTYSITLNQFTFNIGEMIGKVGNGSTATQVNRVFVGEVTISSSVVSAIIWYATLGRYDSGLFAVTTLTTYSKNANVGDSCNLFLFYSSTSTGLPGTNEEVPYAADGSGANNNFRGCYFGQFTRNVVRARTQEMFQVLDVGGSGTNPTSGYIRIIAIRRWG